MKNSHRHNLLFTLAFLLITSISANAQNTTPEKYDLPKDWNISDGAKHYLMGTDKGAGQDGADAITIRSVKGHLHYGTLIHHIDPTQYLGKRIRLTGFVKSANLNIRALVQSWASLWLRVNDADNKVLSFDNMSKRPITGTTGWTKYSLVLDVPATAKDISYGALLNGNGQIWFDDIHIEAVGKDVPTTN